MKERWEISFDVALLDGEILYRGGMDSTRASTAEEQVAREVVNKTKRLSN